MVNNFLFLYVKYNFFKKTIKYFCKTLDLVLESEAEKENFC